MVQQQTGEEKGEESRVSSQEPFLYTIAFHLCENATVTYAFATEHSCFLSTLYSSKENPKCKLTWTGVSVWYRAASTLLDSGHPHTNTPSYC